ncbi:MAG: succinylglutamate desuccinylase/aspartoacylase family protein [Bacteroidota bacterium]
MTEINQPIRVKDLDLSQVKAGSTQRFWVHVVSNGLGQPILVPVMVAKGKQEGPILGVTAAIHGNELNGVPAIQRVFRDLDLHELRGTLVGVPIVNVPGYLLNQRRFNDDNDLNRLMPGSPTGNMSEVYAYRIIKKIVRHVEYLIDLHTASFGRINSYYIRSDMSDPMTARMAHLQNPEIIVDNPPHDGTQRGAVADLGIPAITVEAGNPHTFQKGMIRSAITGIENVMRELKMLDSPIVESDEAPVLCARSYWLYTSAGGVLEVLPSITQQVAKGEKVAIVRNVFGDLIREYEAPEAGIVIGKSVNPIAQTGARILHLGILPS